MLRHSSGQGGSTVLLAYQVDIPPPASGSPSLAGAYIGDPIVENLYQMLQVHLQPYSVRGIISAPGNPYDRPYPPDAIGRKPQHIDYVEHRDFGYYSNGYYALADINRPRFVGDSSKTSPFGENQVRHVYPIGYVSSIDDTSTLNYGDPPSNLLTIGHIPVPAWPRFTTARFSSIRGVVNLGGVVFQGLWSGSSNVRLHMHNTLVILRDAIASGSECYTDRYISLYNREKFSVTNLRFKVAGEGYISEIRYDFEYDKEINPSSLYIGKRITGSMKIEFRSTLNVFPGSVSEIGDHPITARFANSYVLSSSVKKVERRSHIGSWSTLGVEPELYWYHSGSYVPTIYRNPSKDDSDGMFRVAEMLSNGGPQDYPFRDRLDSIRDYVTSHMHEFRPAASIAFHRGVSELTDILKNNYLETLSELNAVASLVPNVAKILQAFSNLRKGKFWDAIHGVKDVVDIVASSKLLYEFGWAPNIEAATELSEQLTPLVNRLSGNLYGVKTTYGRLDKTFEYPIFGYSNVRLTVRNKAVMLFDDNTLLACMLGGRAMGILPQAGNIWDTIQWSFAIDWATQTGARLDVIDTSQVALAATHIYSVHSYKFVFPLGEDVLSPFGLKAQLGTSEDSHPSIVVYIREFSRYVPVPNVFNSKHDFLVPRNGPDGGIVASLVWTLISK